MSPASNLSTKAGDMLKRSPGLEYALAVDDTSHPGQVLLAVARRAHQSCVLAMPEASWSAEVAARVLGEAAENIS